MKLTIGTEQEHGGPFRIPSDFVARTLAIIGARGSGKSTAATVIAEELCKQSLPWMALDPVGVWWGLRAGATAGSKGYPVVVFGGQRGDLPLDKGSGRKIAEACIEAAVFAVIDLSQHSKTVWRMIVRDFMGALQELRPTQPRHVFLEETPEFIPQKASHQLGEECKEICERLVRLGRNWGYGATLLSQRPATIDKDALSQVDNLLVMRTSGAHDRKALREWIQAHAIEADLEKVLDSLASLPDGAGWLWSPQWLKILERIQVRRRETFHPGETRTVGSKAQAVELAPVDEFVARVRKELTKVQAVVPGPAALGKLNVTQAAAEILDLAKDPRTKRILQAANAGVANALEGAQKTVKEHQDRIAELALENGKLRGELRVAGDRARDLERRLDAVRKHLKPEYDALHTLFSEIGGTTVAGSVDAAVWEPWLSKAGKKGCRRMLEILMERREVTRTQLGTLAGVASSGGTFKTYLSWLKTNGLVEVDGDKIRLRAV